MHDEDWRTRRVRLNLWTAEGSDDITITIRGTP